MQGAGLTTSVLYGKNQPGASSSNFWLPYSTVTYYPRYNVIEKANSSISIGLPVGVGVGYVYEVYGGKSGISFAYEFAAALDYNIGCKSTRANPKHVGGYLGTGFNYFHIGGSRNSYLEFRGATYGPIVRGGFRFLRSKGRMAGNALNIGLFYKKGIEVRKVTTFGLNVLWD